MELHYKDLLHQWKNDEDNVKYQLKEIGANVKELTKKVDDLAASTANPVRETNDGGERPFKRLLRQLYNLAFLN